VRACGNRLTRFSACRSRGHHILRQVARGLGAAHDAARPRGLKRLTFFSAGARGDAASSAAAKAPGHAPGSRPEDSFDLVKLLDFGMARFLGPSPGRTGPCRAGVRHASITCRPNRPRGSPRPAQRYLLPGCRVLRDGHWGCPVRRRIAARHPAGECLGQVIRAQPPHPQGRHPMVASMG